VTSAVSAGETRELKGRIRELEQVLGKKTHEDEILAKAAKLAHESKRICRTPLLPEDDPL
jgi:transposase